MEEGRRYGLGCAVAGVLALLVAIAAAFVAWRAVDRAVDASADRARLEQRVRSLLGAVPRDYHPAAIFSLPGVVDLAVLGARPVAEDELDPATEPRLIFLAVPRPSRLWREMLDGAPEVREALAAEGVGVEGSIADGGASDWNGVAARWFAVSGTLRVPGDRQLVGTSILLAPECGSRRMRLVAWSLPGGPPAPASVRRDELLDLVRPIDPCGF